MAANTSLSAENLDPRSEKFGVRDEKGHWRPPYPCRYAPLFAWPPQPLKLLRWLFGYPGYLWPINTFFIGLGLLTLGVPPNSEEVLRSAGFLVVASAYGGVWLAVAMLCSVLFRSAATSALSALGVWLLVSVLWPQVVQFVSTEIYPPTIMQVLFGQPNPDQIMLQQSLSRLSPSTLFGEAVLGILHPTTRSLGIVFMSQLEGAVMGTPLALGQSLLLVWPQVTGLVAGTIILFVVAYVAFQRQEVRA